MVSNTHAVAVIAQNKEKNHMAISNLFMTELDALLAQHGLARGALKNGSINIIDPSGSENEGRRSLRYYGHGFGLEEDDYGAEFTSNGQRFKLVGVKTSRPKYPISAECIQTGTRYKMPRSVVPLIQNTRERRKNDALAAELASMGSPASSSNYDDRYASAGMF
jgi:hypothetical protein